MHFIKSVARKLGFDYLCFGPLRLNSLTLNDTFSCLCGQEVTHQPAVRDVPGSISGPGGIFMLAVLFLLFYIFSSKRHYLS